MTQHDTLHIKHYRLWHLERPQRLGRRFDIATVLASMGDMACHLLNSGEGGLLHLSVMKDHDTDDIGCNTRDLYKEKISQNQCSI